MSVSFTKLWPHGQAVKGAERRALRPGDREHLALGAADWGKLKERLSPDCRPSQERFQIAPFNNLRGDLAVVFGLAGRSEPDWRGNSRSLKPQPD
jgi:hypothetical protein